MRKLILASALTLLASGTAFAGATVGVTMGAEKATTHTNDLMGTGTSTTLGSSGYNTSYGVVLGYNTKLSQTMTAGVDVAFQNELGSLDTTSTTGTGTSTGKIESHKSISAKLGYLVAPTTTIYGRLGKGNADYRYKTVSGSDTVYNFDTTIAGIGVEHEITRNILVSGEYRNTYGSLNGNDVSSAGLEMGAHYRF